MRKANYVILLLLLMLTMALAACGFGGDDSADQGDGSDSGDTNEESEGEASGDQSITVTSKSEIPTMDSALISDSVAFQWSGETVEGLYRLGEDGELRDGIAESSEVSEDGTTYTFKLRDAKWSNGDPVTAQDFVYAWQRAVDPEVGSEYGPYMLGGVVKNATAVSEGEMDVEELGVKAEDDKTFVVNLEKPIPYFESMTAFITFMPQNQDYVEEHGEDYATEAEYTLSNGPFKMTEWDHGSGWKLEKNDSYWDASEVQLNEINVEVVKDTATGVNLYESGQLDFANLSAEFVDQYRSNEGFTNVEKPYLYFFKFNQDNNEALANVNIRKAISMAIDRESLVDVILNDGSVAAEGYVPSNFVTAPDSETDFREVNGQLVEANEEKAKELWQKGLEEIGKDSVTIELLGDDTDTVAEVTAYYKEQIESKLEGATIDVLNVPFKERVRRDQESEFEMEAATWGPDYTDPNTYLNMYLTGGANNNMGYSNDEYDALIEQANNEYAQQPEKRFENFYEAEKILLEEDAAVAPLYQDAKAMLQRPSIKGVYSTATGPEFEFKWAHVEE
ncbi:peptide ABC transporter substrate-binding protein [Thalassobacillus sp. CUG 92003]|uniref:peptide ABC transporter substrate-binding protein n=1 Tax=Thalassobacillus sp. CUG 92003 TaxID=2736641 RepID=UPI0015E78606|nr:peptide ABC transporter substrate-binding protein [Thalassobacillus sp. CUG 92003]